MKDKPDLLSFYLKHAPKSRAQLNGIHEADTEIVKISKNQYLATSIDSFSDEWSVGLYRDPETLVRLCVHGTLSDLVVSGTKPLGFLFSPQWKFGTSDSFKEKIFKYLVKELKRVKVPLLGGDEGYAPDFSLTGVALGLSSTKPKTRVGMKPGDVLCTMGDFGIGPALGFQFIMGAPIVLSESLFDPVAKFSISPTILKYATSSMDTSDGLCSTLQTLSRLNDLRFQIDFDSVKVKSEVVPFLKAQYIPKLALFYGEIGDYQPFFTLRPEVYKKLKSKINGLQKIGEVLPKKSKKHSLVVGGLVQDFDPARYSDLKRDTIPEIKAAFDLMLADLREKR